MTLDKQKLHELVSQMPVIAFSPDTDGVWSENDDVQAYLNFYGINFARYISGVSHGIGRINAAGFRIVVNYWLPQNAKGTLLIVHGYYDHIGIFDNAIRFALERNFAVLTFDLPGHGLSGGEPAVIDSFNEYGDVLAEVLQQSQKLMPLPLHALGQSTGGAVILNYMWRYAASQNAVEQFDKIALCAPLILPRGWRGVYMGRFVYAIMRHLVKSLGRGKSRSSHDPAFNKFVMEEDPLQAKYLSLRWVGAMKEWHHMFRHFEPLQKEVFIVQGTQDMTVDWRYNLQLLEQKLPQSKIALITDAGHQLVNESEPYRTQLFTLLGHYFSN